MPSAAPTVEIEPGKILVGKYRIERVLGKGGMGVVVLATHVELEDRFAIKILIGELDADAQQRFLREARAAAQIKSEHIARVIDVGTLPEGVPFMVMEFLEGTDLAGLIDQRGALPIEETVELMLQACTGLTEAHARDFVHRDIKPANLFVATASDGRRVVKLLDFGISKANAPGQVTLTSTRAVLGTPAYMAPEQWRSAKDADVRSDIWSIGIVLHELLSGKRPFQGESVTEMCAAVLTEDPSPLAISVPALEKVVARCLEKEPEDRYQRIPELARDLAAFAADPDAANELVDRMDRVAGRQSSPSIPRTSLSTPTPPSTHPPDAPLRRPAPTPGLRDTEPSLAVASIASTTVRRKVPRRTLALAIGAAAVLAGAGTYAVTRSSGTTPSSSWAPIRGGTLRVAMSRDDETRISLYAGQPTRTQHALRMVLERLVVIDDTGQLQPSVLDVAEARDDGKSLVLAVRAGVMFHDSPCMVSAEATGRDLQFSIGEAIAQRQLDLDIDHMEASGRELRIAMKTPAQSYLHALSHVWLVPAKLEACERDRKNLQHPVGSGPFRYVPSQLASKLTLARWDGYWRKDDRGEPLPYLDRVELVHVPEASTALAALRDDVRSSKALHIFFPEEPVRSKLIDLSGKLVGEATAGLEVGKRTHSGDAGTWLFEPTGRAGPLDNPKVRRAIALAIDRQAAVDKAKANKSSSSPIAPQGRFLQPTALGYDHAAPELRTDAAAATQLLGEAGYPAGIDLVVGYSHDLAASREVAAALAASGIRITLVKVEMRDQASVLAGNGGVDAQLLSRWGKVLGNELISIGAFDQARRAGIRELLFELASKTLRPDREAVYKRIEAALLAELPSIPIGRLDSKRIAFAAIVRKQVEGFHDHVGGFVPYDDSLTFAETWLRE